MTDVFDKNTRSKNMSRIRGKDTKPELLIRKELHKRGFRYRLHRADLPGKPDIVLPKYSAVIDINGCFWHGHKCHLFKWPESRRDFWLDKLSKNIQRDKKNIQLRQELGWRNLIVWECSLRGDKKLSRLELIELIIEWVISQEGNKHIKGL